MLRPVGVNIIFAHQQLLPNLLQHNNLTRSGLLLFSQGVHVAIGTEPTATDQNFFVTTTDDEVLSLGIVESQRVVGMTYRSPQHSLTSQKELVVLLVSERAVSLTVDGQSAP